MNVPYARNGKDPVLSQICFTLTTLCFLLLSVACDKSSVTGTQGAVQGSTVKQPEEQLRCAPTPSTCPPSEKFVCNKCVPIICPTNQVLKDSVCVSPCDSGQVIQNGKCIERSCPNGAILMEGKCVYHECGPSQVPMNGSCKTVVCGDGQVMENNVCAVVTQTVAPEGSTCSSELLLRYTAMQKISGYLDPSTGKTWRLFGVTEQILAKPVNYVTWGEADAGCKAMGLRLPNLAEAKYFTATLLPVTNNNCFGSYSSWWWETGSSVNLAQGGAIAPCLSP